MLVLVYGSFSPEVSVIENLISLVLLAGDKEAKQQTRTESKDRTFGMPVKLFERVAIVAPCYRIFVSQEHRRSYPY